MIHLDRIEWAVFRTVATVHADINIDIKLQRFGDRAVRFGVIGADDPDALGGANLGTDPTGGAAVLMVAFLINIID